MTKISQIFDKCTRVYKLKIWIEFVLDKCLQSAHNRELTLISAFEQL